MLNKDLAGAIMAYKYDALSPANKKAIIAAFNEKDKTGIKFLGDKLGITDDPDALAIETARFLIAERNALNLDNIGECLAFDEGKKTNKKILEAFFNQQDFQGVEFTTALRQFLTSFNLPGEAQKIDRVMEAFAARYVAQNPTKFESQDAAYVLAFSVIMLNTDLHNPSIELKKKITLEQFIRNNRGINNGKDFSSEFLTKIYNEIKQNEIKPNITRIAPGFTLDFKDKTHHSQAKNLKKYIDDPATLIQKVFPDKLYTTAISKPKKWLNKLLGYEGTITIKDGNNPVATVQIYSPGLLSRNKHPKIIVQPTHEANKANKNDISVAARIAASFGVAPTIAATYDYQKQELGAAYAAASKKPKPPSVRSSSLPTTSTRTSQSLPSVPPLQLQLLQKAAKAAAQRRQQQNGERQPLIPKPRPNSMNGDQ